MPARVGDDLALQRYEVANWFVWGPPWTEDATSAQTFMALTRQIQTMMQVAADEPDAETRREHRQTIVQLVDDLRRASGIQPGVMERQALRDEMENAPREGETR